MSCQPSKPDRRTATAPRRPRNDRARPGHYTQLLAHALPDRRTDQADQYLPALDQAPRSAACRLLLQAPVASDLRFLLTVLRIAPELERTHDLECQIAARPHLAADLPPRSRGLIEQMGELASEIWGQAADCWYQRDGSAAPVLVKVNDKMHELHTALATELASGRMPLPVAIEMALVGRFYERLGDHAVNITRRVGYLTGSPTG